MIEDNTDFTALTEMLQLDLPEEYISQTPLPKQHLFLWVPHKEVLFGGAAGPGKSSALLMAALQYVHKPNYNSLLLRRTYQDLSQPGGLMDRAHQWLAPARKKGLAHWDKQEKRWTFPSGSTLSFGYCDTEGDVYNYAGAEYQMIGWDEVTQFTETMYTFLFSRLRKSLENPIPLRVRCTANPNGIGLQWVRERFLPQFQMPTDDEEELEEREERLFIPSNLSDNPHIDRDGYEKMLKKLDPVSRAQLLHGDWEIEAEGNMFRKEWFDGRILNTAIVDNKVQLPEKAVTIVRKVRYWDLASTDESKVRDKKGDADYTASCLLGYGDDGNVYVMEVSRDRLSPSKVENLVRSKAERDGRVGTMTFLEQEPGSSGVNTVDHYRRYVLQGFPFWGDRPTGDKVERARAVSAACEHGQVYIIQGEKTRLFLNEMQAFPMGLHDDMVDAFAGAFLQLSTYCTIGKTYVKKPKGRRRSIWG